MEYEQLGSYLDKLIDELIKDLEINLQSSMPKGAPAGLLTRLKRGFSNWWAGLPRPYPVRRENYLQLDDYTNLNNCLNEVFNEYMIPSDELHKSNINLGVGNFINYLKERLARFKGDVIRGFMSVNPPQPVQPTPTQNISEPQKQVEPIKPEEPKSQVPEPTQPESKRGRPKGSKNKSKIQNTSIKSEEPKSQEPIQPTEQPKIAPEEFVNKLKHPLSTGYLKWKQKNADIAAMYKDKEHFIEPIVKQLKQQGLTSNEISDELTKLASYVIKSKDSPEDIVEKLSVSSVDDLISNQSIDDIWNKVSSRNKIKLTKLFGNDVDSIMKSLEGEDIDKEIKALVELSSKLSTEHILDYLKTNTPSEILAMLD